ncbi:hypothetical protein PCANC_22358 [Puccinia coronata f. sp. avenae]|uniref:DNA 3'-5' helicase n=1 Tax=Puccinia coronata f. sp. avenae TaxID=200324 RepID=A0A2N5U1Z0_9BASI|nr:hypothetical protein PCANC_22358 [Puccinia coronata f. sp. avenae]
MTEKPNQSLSAAIGHRVLKHYSVPAIPLQIDTVVNLARGRNVMLHAGTGFVSEKKKAGFSAINLTKLTFNPAEAAKICHGEYSFVYLSPKIFLNSKLFSSIYFSPEFQSCLALVVVDEAHLIYHWGMQPPGSQWSPNPPFVSNLPPPRPLRAIQRNLRLNSTKLVILQGELTRPEIRIIRVFMKGSMTSFTDLERLYSPISDTPNKKVVPSFIYCSTWRKTGQVLEVLAPACGTPNNASKAGSLFSRCYHSVTGDQDKQDVKRDFGEGFFPVISCTMALGLGQNWMRV